ncbi:siderophore ferric iron reductase [Marinobacter bohaiensis]|uniref:siderophore ferric iron reductase n=1 Tax=Marinobacter bohaiensis TaxID=2201898 RepID=UPI000DAC4791|nr:siderophore ferric iron reductase [Marinobacter bohaiensis]
MSLAHRTTPLDHFYALTARVYPALAGGTVISDEQCICAEQDNSAVIQRLYDTLQNAHPEAGMPYWSVRTWSLLVWQPVFLTVLGVHGAGVVPPLLQMRQKLGHGFVAGYDLPEDAWYAGAEDHLVEVGARTLRELCDTLLAELREITLLKPLSAMRLVADSVLAAISRLHEIRPDIDQQRQLKLAWTWLRAMGLEGQSALMPLPLPDGRTPLALDRKGCCMHYRRHDGDLCATCPKQKDDVRFARMKEELSHNA